MVMIDYSELMCKMLFFVERLANTLKTWYNRFDCILLHSAFYSCGKPPRRYGGVMENLFSSNIDFFGSHALDSLSTFKREEILVVQEKHFKNDDPYPYSINSLIDTNENPDKCISSTYNSLYDESETFIPSTKKLNLLSHKFLLE